jgi:hypothetical protein
VAAGAREALHALVRALARSETPFVLVGAQAVIAHGAPRLTGDVDVIVQLTSIDERALLADLHREGFTVRVDDPVAFAARTRVFPLWHDASGYGVDVMLGGPGLEETFLARAVERVVEGLTVRVVRAEDLVVMKLLAGRPKDDDDVAGVLAAQGAAFDAELARATLRTIEEALDRDDLVKALDAALLRVPKKASTRRPRKPRA